LDQSVRHRLDRDRADLVLEVVSTSSRRYDRVKKLGSDLVRDALGPRAA
jgi:hypothetical protein